MLEGDQRVLDQHLGHVEGATQDGREAVVHAHAVDRGERGLTGRCHLELGHFQARERMERKILGGDGGPDGVRDLRQNDALEEHRTGQEHIEDHQGDDGTAGDKRPATGGTGGFRGHDRIVGRDGSGSGSEELKKLISEAG